MRLKYKRTYTVSPRGVARHSIQGRPWCHSHQRRWGSWSLKTTVSSLSIGLVSRVMSMDSGGLQQPQLWQTRSSPFPQLLFGQISFTCRVPIIAECTQSLLTGLPTKNHATCTDQQDVMHPCTVVIDWDSLHGHCVVIAPATWKCFRHMWASYLATHKTFYTAIIVFCVYTLWVIACSRLCLLSKVLCTADPRSFQEKLLLTN